MVSVLKSLTLHFTLSLHFTPGPQGAFYTDYLQTRQSHFPLTKRNSLFSAAVLVDWIGGIGAWFTERSVSSPAKFKSSSTRGPELYQASCTLRCYRYYYIQSQDWQSLIESITFITVKRLEISSFVLAFLAPSCRRAWRVGRSLVTRLATRMTLATRYSWLHVSHSSHALLHNIVVRHTIVIC